MGAWAARPVCSHQRQARGTGKKTTLWRQHKDASTCHHARDDAWDGDGPRRGKEAQGAELDAHGSGGPGGGETCGWVVHRARDTCVGRTWHGEGEPGGAVEGLEVDAALLAEEHGPGEEELGDLPVQHQHGDGESDVLPRVAEREGHRRVLGRQRRQAHQLELERDGRGGHGVSQGKQRG